MTTGQAWRASTLPARDAGRHRLLASATAFALAFLAMVTVHELGHVAADVALGGSPVLYGFSVDTSTTSTADEIVTALAGPLVSLVTGLVVLALPWRPVSPFWRLVVLWFGLTSVQEFSGYLITGPFAGVGDIGQVLTLSGAPAAVGWLGFVVGWAITYLLGRHAVRRLAGFVTADEPFGTQLRQLGLISWLIGAVVSIVLSLGLLTAGGVSGAVVAFEAFGVVTSGIFLVFVRMVMGPAAAQPRAATSPRPTVAGIVALLVLALVRQLLLAGGLHV
jgi:hypothetical protein